MRLKIAALSLLGCLVAVHGLPPLKRNIAYRSPTEVIAQGFAHDIDSIGRGILERSQVGKRSLESALDGNAADQLVDEYNPETGADGQHSYQGGITFPYGVASGDPHDDSAILWTHPVPSEKTSGQPICLRYETSKVKDSWSKHDVVDIDYAWTTADVDYSFKVETINLKPLTQYYYRFSACHDRSIVSPTGTFKTIPKPLDSDVSSLKMAVFSCANYPNGFFNSFRHAAKVDIDLVVFLGDYIYEYAADGSPGARGGDGRPLNRVPQPNKECVTLDDYRTRYATYRSDADLQELHRSKPWLLIWDDHEIADNTYNAGSARGNNTEAGSLDGVRFSERKKNAVKAYFEWMPIRQVDTAGADTLRIWRKFQYGKLADIMLLDTRDYDRDVTDLYYNTAQIASVANDSDRSLMGGKQERALYHTLLHSQERGTAWRIIGQQVIVNHLEYHDPNNFNINLDAWDGYRANRRRLFDTIQANKMDNVIFLSGDSHANWVFDTIYQEWVNRTDLYDPSTGKGSIAVEFAGTAVSSLSSYGANLTAAQYQAKAERHVKQNRNLAWAEGDHRGYFVLDIKKDQLDAHFYGMVNNKVSDSPQLLLSSFNVKRGANKLTRPINGGEKAVSGAIQEQTVDYEKLHWNGTAFE